VAVVLAEQLQEILQTELVDQAVVATEAQELAQREM
jgi:hypothetical protein